MTLLRQTILCATIALFSGCARPDAQPARLGLKLAPQTLGESIALQQHLTVEREDRTNDLDVALEVDAEHVSLVGLAFGQRVMSFEFDGKTLNAWRHPLLPSQVRSGDVLEDIQLTYWPADALNQVLPEGWRVEDNALRRILWSGDTQVATIDYSGMPRWSGKVVFVNLRYGYRLTILSAPLTQ